MKPQLLINSSFILCGLVSTPLLVMIIDVMDVAEGAGSPSTNFHNHHKQSKMILSNIDFLKTSKGQITATPATMRRLEDLGKRVIQVFRGVELRLEQQQQESRQDYKSPKQSQAYADDKRALDKNEGGSLGDQPMTGEWHPAKTPGRLQHAQPVVRKPTAKVPWGAEDLTAFGDEIRAVVRQLDTEAAPDPDFQLVPNDKALLTEWHERLALLGHEIREGILGVARDDYATLGYDAWVTVMEFYRSLWRRENARKEAKAEAAKEERAYEASRKWASKHMFPKKFN